VLLLATTIFERIDAAANFLTAPSVLFALSIGLLILSLKFAHIWTKPPIAIGIALFLLLVGVYSCMDWPGVDHSQFRENLTKADNLPIVIILSLIFLTYWISLRRATQNDKRISEGLPPLEASEKNRKVLVWPDLVYTELIAMVICTTILILWSVGVPAPIEEPANLARTPNPSKAPWYFLGLQEMLVYFDPWLAGVVLPALIMVGLIAIPYIDRNPKGNGYYTLQERKMAIFIFLFGFLILWVLQVFLGTFLRGPGWNFFGVYEYWDHNKVESLKNIDISELFYVNLLGGYEPDNVLLRELPGILMVVGYMTIFPLLIAKTVGKKLFRELGAIRFGIVVNLGLIMFAVPLKMVLRWAINLKYIVNLDIPGVDLNI
jgi:hypothetical protein